MNLMPQIYVSLSMLEKHIKCFNSGQLPGAEHNPLAADDILHSSEDCCLVAEKSSLDVALRAIPVLMRKTVFNANVGTIFLY